MPGGHGSRARTRYAFSRPFRGKGYIPLSTYLRVFKIGDYVDVKVNGAVQKGMPFKWYHGKTGVVWNVTKRAVGVEINKLVGNRIIKKRIHARTEHVQSSRCREDFLKRRAANQRIREEAKQAGEKPVVIKRQPKGPQPGYMLENVQMETVAAIPYDIIKEGLV